MLLTIITFILVLGFLVFIHEMGHFLAARHVGVRVDEFSIGFPPKIWSKRIHSERFGTTEYCISWIPLGGYVRLFGQNSDDEEPDNPSNYASKTKWQRFYILVAGPLMNLAFAFLLMPFIYWSGLETPKYLNESPVIATVPEGSFVQRQSFQVGDLIVQAQGQDVKTWSDLYQLLPQGSTDSFKVVLQRDSRLIEVQDRLQLPQDYNWGHYVAPTIGSFSPDSPAEKSGFLVNDRVLQINQQPVDSWYDIAFKIQATQSLQTQEAKEIDVLVSRDGQEVLLSLKPYFHTQRNQYLIGISPLMESSVQSYSLGESVAMGTNQLVTGTLGIFSFLKTVVTGNASLDHVGGPIQIGSYIGQAARSGVNDLLMVMALISLQLGILNLLPIPALDGGHIFLLGVEYVLGKPMSLAVREKLQFVGFSTLVLLMLLVTYNDVIRIFFS